MIQYLGKVILTILLAGIAYCRPRDYSIAIAYMGSSEDSPAPVSGETNSFSELIVSDFGKEVHKMYIYQSVFNTAHDKLNKLKTLYPTAKMIYADDDSLYPNRNSTLPLYHVDRTVPLAKLRKIKTLIPKVGWKHSNDYIAFVINQSKITYGTYKEVIYEVNIMFTTYDESSSTYYDYFTSGSRLLYSSGNGFKYDLNSLGCTGSSASSSSYDEAVICSSGFPCLCSS